MKKPSEAQVNSAKLLLVREGQDAPDCADAALRIYEKISLRLSPVIGSAGVRALFARSLKQAQGSYPSLGSILEGSEDVRAQLGTPEGALRSLLEREGAEAAKEATVFLFATFFMLLATFVGDRLVAQVLQESWPELTEPGPRERTKK